MTSRKKKKNAAEDGGDRKEMMLSHEERALMIQLGNQLSRIEQALEQRDRGASVLQQRLLNRVDEMGYAVSLMARYQAENRRIGEWLISKYSWPWVLEQLTRDRLLEELLKPELRALLAAEWALTRESRETLLKKAK